MEELEPFIFYFFCKRIDSFSKTKLAEVYRSGSSNSSEQETTKFEEVWREQG